MRITTATVTLAIVIAVAILIARTVFLGRSGTRDPATIQDGAASERPEKVRPEDEEIVEEWARLIGDDARGVDVVRIAVEGEWQWEVYISALEFVREKPLEPELARSLEAKLSQVPGAKQVVREDTETFIVDGDPSGEALALAACEVVDAFADRIRRRLDSL